ncbi:hypothetical protein AKJ51_03635 [candidate division MSBL1 archaeon SCGC-AAA382A20]|uniref:Cobalamin-binding protein n=1 Tax=candidate division MSBL1 archaeon SCGC-AAA382A20 TaxID=1698280 RepID=A0A133VJ75_9EURY|nr:hypothetical protein AKJ51_03635 [candidate division MSBL1 archaeon SCGC-AAA382A20]
MANKEEILKKLREAVENQDVEGAKKAAEEALDADIKPFDAVNKGLGKGMETISDRFDKADIYLPEIMLSADAMEAALDVFRPVMEEADKKGKGTVVMGTVEGDIHVIGKKVCMAMLRGAGYTVIDTGGDTPTEKFREKAEEVDADVVGASSLMSTSKPIQEEVADACGDDFITIHGGAPVTEEFIKEIGGDAYVPNGAAVVKTVNRLMGQ